MLPADVTGIDFLWGDESIVRGQRFEREDNHPFYDHGFRVEEVVSTDRRPDRNAPLRATSVDIIE